MDKSNRVMDKPKLILIGLVVLTVIAGVGYSQFLSKENSKLKKEITALKKDPQSVAREEVKQLVSVVSKLVVLPDGEDPVVATVTDKDKLKDQPVFARTENGDKILIYSNSKKAYVYRPSKNMIVDVVPVNIGDSNPQIAGTTADKPLRVALVNGTKTSNLANDLEKRIVDKKVTGITVVSKATAKSSDYKKTLVIDITGKLGQQAASLAQLLDADVATQTGETKPNADLMVIIGANFK